MLCSRCGKHQAVVFVTGVYKGQSFDNDGLCLTCASQLGVPQVEEIKRCMGIGDSEISAIEDQLAALTAEGGPLEGMIDESGAMDPDAMIEMIKNIDLTDLSDLMESVEMSDLGMGIDEDDADGEDEEEEEELPEEKPEEKKPEDKEKKNPPKKREFSVQIIPLQAVESDDDDDDDDSDGDDDGDGEGKTPHFFAPLEQLFGKSFEPGNTAYANDGKGKKGKKGKKHKFLDTYCTHLTGKAREGKIDRIIGRDREIERIIQILSRRQKNNPCLIGEPGVGKTAIAEGLARKIVAKDVPARLAGKEVYLLDLTALVAGTQFRGQFESRIKGLIDEVKAVGNIILFIDEIHNIVGAGDAEGSSMSAANILKPALSRGELQVIGATTFAEYRKHIEKDTALERRFQPVKVEEPSVEETITVLRGIKDYYESFHRVNISNELIAKAVRMSERYITDRFLPDKAIDLLDEACSCANLRNKELAEYSTLCLRLEDLTAQKEEMSQKIDDEIDFEQYYKIQTEINQIEAKIAILEPSVKNFQVSEQDLAHVIELWTGIQASRVGENEYSKLARLADRLKEKVKGQDEAVDLVAAAIRRTRVQISPRKRPASFIFVGPTGVGKTELVKVLAAELFDTPDTLIRLDMSEFMDKHTVSRIIGSPPGYVGYDEAGQLTEKVRRKPYSVVLFDEIEKAHPDVLNILLQILDEGKINDAQGRTVSFANTVIIMTSNAGSHNSGTSLGFGKTENEQVKEKVMKALSDFLRPEFLARVDEVVCFNVLSEDDFRQIARLMCEEYVPALAERGITLTVSEEAELWLAQHSMGGKSAARDLRNLIRREVEDGVTQLIIDNMGEAITSITVVVEDDKIKLLSE